MQLSALAHLAQLGVLSVLADLPEGFAPLLFGFPLIIVALQIFQLDDIRVLYHGIARQVGIHKSLHILALASAPLGRATFPLDEAAY